MSSEHYLSFDKREERPWQNSRLAHGCIVGHTTTNTSKVWVRVHEEGVYTLVLSENKLMGLSYKDVSAKDIQIPLTITESTLLTEVFDIGPKYKLQEGTRYYYAVAYKGRWVLGIDKNNSFKTFTDSGRLVFGFYSCHMPFEKEGFFGGVTTSSSIENWSNFHEVLTRNHADFVIGGGDQVYTDGHDKISIWAFLEKHKDEVASLKESERRRVMLSWYDDIYRGYWGFNSIKRVFAEFPNYMTWDDHEVRDGWGSFDEEEIELVFRDGIVETSKEKSINRKLMYEMFKAASESYYYYQHSHNPSTDNYSSSAKEHEMESEVYHRRWHYDFNAKGSAFFVFDTRGHKSMDDRDPNKKNTPEEGKNTLLGQPQINDFMMWLESQDQAESIFLISAVPFIHWKSYVLDIAEMTNLGGLRDDVRDEWDHELNHHERDQLIEAIFKYSEANKKKVFILSGDVHCAASFQLKKKASDARVYQLTSSAITYAKTLPSWVVKKAVHKHGEINGLNGNYYYERLTPVEVVNNFSTITIEECGLVHFDLYGRAEKDDGMLMYKRLTL